MVKRDRMQQDVLKWGKWLIILVFFLLLIQVASYLEPIWLIGKTLILPLVVACVLAYLLHPIIEKLASFGLSRGLATALLFLAFLLTVALILVIGVPVLIRQVNEAIDVLPEHLASIKETIFTYQKQLSGLPDPIQVHVEEWTNRVETFTGSALDQLERVILTAIQSIMVWVVVPFIVFYLLKDYTLVQRVGFYITPRKWREKVHFYIRDVDKTFGSYIRGQLLVALCVGVISTITFWILGVPYPIVLGLFVGATDLIPYFGAFISAIPAVGVALLDSTSLGIYVAIALFIIQQIEGNVLSPLIVGRTVHLHPILIIFALLIGVEVAGVIGLLIAVPVTAILKVTLLHIRQYLKGEVEYD